MFKVGAYEFVGKNHVFTISGIPDHSFCISAVDELGITLSESALRKKLKYWVDCHVVNALKKSKVLAEVNAMSIRKGDDV